MGCLTYPIVVMVTIAHQNPSKAPWLNPRGNSSGLCLESFVSMENKNKNISSRKLFIKPRIHNSYALQFLLNSRKMTGPPSFVLSTLAIKLSSACQRYKQRVRNSACDMKILMEFCFGRRFFVFAGF